MSMRDIEQHDVRQDARRTLVRMIIVPVLLVLAALYLADRLYDPAQFRITAIEVRGHFHRVDAAQVKAAVENGLRGNYFSVDLADVAKNAESLAWVFRASVRRQWPGLLAVDVVEVQPVAQWGTGHWVHIGGAIVARDDADKVAELRHALPSNLLGDLPQLSAPDAHQAAVWAAYQRWSKLFADLDLRIDEMHLDARGLWRLRVSPGAVEVIVARENAQARIAQFIGALRHPQMADFSKMRSVDLRHPNGFAVGWKGAPPKSPKSPKSSPTPSLAGH